MRSFILVVVIVVVISCARSGKTASTTSTATGKIDLRLTRKLPVYLMFSPSTVQLQAILTDSLKRMGFSVIDQQGMLDVMRSNSMSMVSRMSKDQKDVMVNGSQEEKQQILQNGPAIFQSIGLPKVDSGFVMISRINPHKRGSHVFRIPYAETEAGGLLASRILDSLLGRH